MRCPSKTLILFLLLALVGLAGLSMHLWRTMESSAPPSVSGPPGAAEIGAGAPVPRDLATSAPVTPPFTTAASGARQVSDHVLPLTYAQAWSGPLPPAMEAFRDWAWSYAEAETGFDQAFLELDGIAIARARRAEMLALIETDPELALALTVPAAVRALLPASVDALLETRVSGRGDYEILMAVQPLGSRRPEEMFRRVTCGGHSYDAFVYGRRATQHSQEGASLHGIALEGRMAVHESPLRVLEPGEVLEKSMPAGHCPVSGEPVGALRAGSEVNLHAATVIEADGQLWQLAETGLVDVLEADLVAAEDADGPSVPNILADPVTQPLAPTPWTTGEKTLLIIRVDFSDKPGDPYTYDATLNLMNNSVNPYFDASSYGATSIATTVTATTYRMPQTAEAYATGNLSSQLYTDATAAAGADYTVANYKHVMIVFTRLGSITGSKFTWAGLGSVGGGRTWINGYYDFRVVSHELGHNFGLYHANLWQVSDGNPASSSGTSTEYADPFDAMGGGSTNANHHFNPWFKNRLGWLPDAAVRPVTTSGTYRVTRFDSKTAPLDQDLALNVFADGTRTYWIGFRQNLTSNTSVFNGAYVLWGFRNNTQSQLLDMTTPGSSANDAGLRIGATFTDAARGVSIRPVAKGGTAGSEYLDVEITLGQPSSPFVVGWGSTQAVSAIPVNTTGVRAVAAGAQHALALKTDGTVVAWGSNTSGQSTVPAGLSNVVAVAARGNISGAVKGDGSVAVWGSTAAGQATIPGTAGTITSLSLGADHVLALRSDGTVAAWGNNSHGETSVPSGLSGVVAVAAGTDTSYAVHGNGSVSRWGSMSGTMPAGLSGVVAIAAGSQHALALKSDGTVVGWGSNGSGQAVVPSGLTGVVAIAAGASHSAALKSDGTVVQWGAASVINATPPAVSRVSTLAAAESGTVAVIGASIAASLAFTEQPLDRSVTAGQSASFAVTAAGSGTITYQWERRAAGSTGWTTLANNSTYAGVTTSTLAVSATTAAMHGDQFRCVASFSGDSPTTSQAALLSVLSPPVIGTPPVSSVGTAGGALTLSVGATGSGTLTYQWRLNGVAIAGATAASYTLPSVQAFHAGSYSVTVTGSGLSTTSPAATVTVNPPPASTARVMNLSTRATASSENILIPGFVIEGAGTKRLLIRAVGPTLGTLGVSGSLADPRLVLKRFDAGVNDYVDIRSNDDWGTNTDAAQIASTAASLGAFALNAGSADAAVLVDLAPGRYTVVASGQGAASGLAMVELYDADAGASTARLVNLSNRGHVGVGSSIMIPGFVVSSEGSRTFLIRAVGPTLGGLGVTGTLADPQLTIYSGNTPILSNNDWDGIAGSTTTRNVAVQVGAFPLTAGSRDAAFVVTLPPGPYTVQASGVGGTTGEALVEVYLVP